MSLIGRGSAISGCRREVRDVVCPLQTAEHVKRPEGSTAIQRVQ